MSTISAIVLGLTCFSVGLSLGLFLARKVRVYREVVYVSNENVSNSIAMIDHERIDWARMGPDYHTAFARLTPGAIIWVNGNVKTAFRWIRLPVELSGMDEKSKDAA